MKFKKKGNIIMYTYSNLVNRNWTKFELDKIVSSAEKQGNGRDFR